MNKNNRDQLSIGFRIFTALALAISVLAGLAFWIISAIEAQGAAMQSIVINEVAWAGSEASPNDEWIELYNPTDYEVNLDGWQLYTLEGNLAMSLDGLTIGQEGLLLLERHEQAVSDVTADKIYGGYLHDYLEELHLRNSNGQIVSVAKTVCGNAFCGWPAGTLPPLPHTMERDYGSTLWHTNDGLERNGLDSAGHPINGTPRQENSQWPRVIRIPVSYLPIVANGD